MLLVWLFQALRVSQDRLLWKGKACPAPTRPLAHHELIVIRIIYVIIAYIY